MSFKSQRTVSAIEFDAVLPFLHKMGADRRDAARLVMVEGKSQTEVAEAYGWTRNNVSVIVKLVWNEIMRLRESAKASGAQLPLAAADGDAAFLPPGFARATFVAPTELIERWRAELASYTAASKPASRARSGAHRYLRVYVTGRPRTPCAWLHRGSCRRHKGLTIADSLR